MPLLVERTDKEKEAYLQGFRAGAKMFQERLTRYLATEGRTEMKAASEEVESVAKMIEESLHV